jgi:RHS repeat-associated protein
MVSSQSDVAVNMETRKSSTGPPARIAVDRRTINGLTRAYSYAYNLDGSLYTVTHPDALVVTFQPGGAGRPISEVSGDAGYATNVHYAPNGSLCYAVQGWGTTTTLDRTFNNRFQPIRIFESGTAEPAPPQCAPPTQTSDLPVDFTYSYTDANGHNNGNVAQITNSDWTRTQYFTYDSLNRVATAKTGATNQPAFQGDTNSIKRCWGEQFGYDPWGNLVSISSVSSLYTGCTQESLSVAVGTKNQIIGDTYDSAGNLIIAQPGNFQYTYDAENHLTATSGQTYLYDGDGKRVEKASGSPLVANKLYWYGSDSSPVIETDAAGNELYRYFSFAGLLVAREEANDWVDHYGVDALGNVRWLYSNLGAWDIIDYYPFGGERLSYSTSAGNNTRLFTGKERDAESGLDNFEARYNNSSLGRFMSPDPIGGQKIDPQTLNKYSYVRNNPINFTDPTGLYTCKDDNNKCQTKKDIAFEKSRQQDLKSKDADVVRAANAYGDPTKDNHVSVGFADLDKKGEGGVTTSTLGADDKGNLFAQSDVTINSKLSGSALDAAVGHEGSHVADAQDVASSISLTNTAPYFKIGMDITRYQSEQRAYAVTDSILKSGNENWHFACGLSDCVLGTGKQMLSQRAGVIDQIMANSPLYRSDGRPLSSTNQGGSVIKVVPQ